MNYKNGYVLRLDFCEDNDEINKFNIKHKDTLIHDDLSPLKALKLAYKDKITIDALKNKKFYRYPNLTLPRDKMNILKEKFNVSIKRKPEDADYSIINIDYLTKKLYKNWRTYLSKIELISILRILQEHFNPNVIDKLGERLKTVHSNDDYFYLDLNIGWCYRHSCNAYNAVQDTLKDKKGGSFYRIDPEYTCLFSELSLNANLITDDALLNIISADSITITEETYDSLINMITSSNAEDNTMALEIMSNCNVATSYDKLACLLFYHEAALKSFKNWNNINVKSLRKRMKTFLDNYSCFHSAHPYNEFLQKLIKADYLTEFAIKITGNHLFNDVLKDIFYEKSMFEFKLSDLKLKAEFKNIIKKNKEGVDIITNPVELF